MENQDRLLKILKNIKSDEDLADFLVGILTPAEIDQINQRIEIISMLKNGISQHRITEKLKVGIATVTRGSRMIKEGHFKQDFWA